MFQREPSKWRTQELSLAPLFQPKFSITTPETKTSKQERISKDLYPFYANFPQVSLLPNREIVTHKRQM